MKLVVINKEEFKSIYEKMTTSFASDEIRTLEDAYKILDVKEYKVFHLTLNNNNIGFITIWNLDTCTFVEHFVIYEEYRNKGYGTLALTMLCNLAKQKGIKVLADTIAIDNPSINIFFKQNFKEIYRTNDYILVRKELF